MTFFHLFIPVFNSEQVTITASANEDIEKTIETSKQHEPLTHLKLKVGSVFFFYLSIDFSIGQIQNGHGKEMKIFGEYFSQHTTKKLHLLFPTRLDQPQGYTTIIILQIFKNLSEGKKDFTKLCEPFGSTKLLKLQISVNSIRSLFPNALLTRREDRI